MKAAALDIKGLGKSYDGKIVFEKLSFQVPAGGAVAIVGPSGCGKSTLLHILAGLEKGDQGQVDIFPPEADLALVLQHYGLFPWKTAWANVELPLKLRGLPKFSRLRRVAAMFNELGLPDLKRRYPGQLSGGQQQRLALGRALVAEPQLLLLDEPFSSLDAINREELQNLLAALRKKYELTYVLTTHSIEEAVFLGARILVMGGQPSGFIADFENPAFDKPEARVNDAYFELVKKIRLSLAGACGPREPE